MTSSGKKCVVLILIGLICTSAKAVKKNVTIAKCCALDETLTSDYKCLKSFNSSWDLRIYVNQSLARYTGSLPPRWELKENTQPQCTERVIEDLSMKNVIPFINGYMLSVIYEKKIAPHQFCLDYDYAIYCRPGISPERITSVLVKKCCGKDAIFSETNSSCIDFNDQTYSIDIGQDKSIGAGFPACPEQKERVVAGKLHQAQLMSNGSLWVNASDVLLPSANYCLEHILEQAGKSIE